jgi:nitronate monooxygenase
VSDRPLAVNLLLPFARRAHFEAASEADVVVTFWGSPKRERTGPSRHFLTWFGLGMAEHDHGVVLLDELVRLR